VNGWFSSARNYKLSIVKAQSTLHRQKTWLTTNVYRAVKDAGKDKTNIDLYSTSLRTPLTRSDMVHTVLPANNAISAFTRKHSPGGATTHTHIANDSVQLTTHLSTPGKWMTELAMLADIQRMVYLKRSPVNCTSWCTPGKVRWSKTNVLTNCATPPTGGLEVVCCLTSKTRRLCLWRYCKHLSGLFVRPVNVVWVKQSVIDALWDVVGEIVQII